MLLPDQDWLALLGRRLRLMLIAVIAPELMVGFAARQFFAARRFLTEFGVPLTHGFFSMGPEYLSAIRKVKEADITIGSKGDALSKGVALNQGLDWSVYIPHF
ncbi:hypothetical protein C8R44DRAFT_893341 [Mycena epipterygia]|nr:hypothetical protein C8R44DRAFT_893341 [Mycena epipterygia]